NNPSFFCRTTVMRVAERHLQNQAKPPLNPLIKFLVYRSLKADWTTPYPLQSPPSVAPERLAFHRPMQKPPALVLAETPIKITDFVQNLSHLLQSPVQRCLNLRKGYSASRETTHLPQSLLRQLHRALSLLPDTYKTK